MIDLFSSEVLMSLSATGLVDVVAEQNRGFGLGIAALAGLVDALKPYGIGILVTMIGFLLLHTKDRQRAKHLAAMYVGVVFAATLAVGLYGVDWWTDIIQTGWYQITHDSIAMILVIVLMVVGLTHLESFTLDRKFFLSRNSSIRLGARAFLRATDAVGAVLLALLTSLFLFPVTEHEYVGAFKVMVDTFGGLQAAGYMLVYQLFFMLPLILLFAIILRVERHVREEHINSSEERWLKLVKAFLQFGSAAIIYWAVFHA